MRYLILYNMDPLWVSVCDTQTMYGFHTVLVQWSLMLIKVTAYLYIVLMSKCVEIHLNACADALGYFYFYLLYGTSFLECPCESGVTL